MSEKLEFGKVVKAKDIPISQKGARQTLYDKTLNHVVSLDLPKGEAFEVNLGLFPKAKPQSVEHALRMRILSEDKPTWNPKWKGLSVIRRKTEDGESVFIKRG